jgi:ATP-dependent RNA helicase DDX49/DBP8
MPPATAASFAELGVNKALCATCRSLAIRVPTPIQSLCIPPILRGDDVIGIAATGSGKTAAFALPILQDLHRDPRGVFALVLSPTRELALQIADQFRALGAPDTSCVAAVGGLNILEQASLLERRPHVVVATPGRIQDLLASNPTIKRAFAGLKYLVLDEADRLLEASFGESLAAILGCLPAGRRTLLFTATVSPQLRAIAKRKNVPLLNAEAAADATDALSAVQLSPGLDQRYVHIPQLVKEAYLSWLLESFFPDRPVIVFTPTVDTAQVLTFTFQKLGVPGGCVGLHGGMHQGARLAALSKFRLGTARVLFATDVAARGLDIPSVELVVNYDVPRHPEDYVHRVGRTARAARSGLSVALVGAADVELVHAIEATTGSKMKLLATPEPTILAGLTRVSKAVQEARLDMGVFGIDSKLAVRTARRKRDAAISHARATSLDQDGDSIPRTSTGVSK